MNYIELNKVTKELEGLTRDLEQRPRDIFARERVSVLRSQWSAPVNELRSVFSFWRSSLIFHIFVCLGELHSGRSSDFEFDLAAFLLPFLVSSKIPE